jgi:hypothetical protein
MSESFSISVGKRHGFGALATIALAGQPERRLTLAEASILASALDAIAEGASPERRIYMSPIASDHDFDASAGPEGIVVVLEGRADLRLDWRETRALALALKAAAERAP